MKTSFFGAALLAASVLAPAGASTFDKPQRVQVIKLPPEPENPQSTPTRSCTYYPGFLVKEIDLGEVGAAELTITQVHGTPPQCTTKIAGERKIAAETWSGYFKGAKGDFVFFDGEDGWNDGMPFAVLSATTGHKLFEDTRKGDGYAAIDLEEGALVLRYRRVWQAPCSLMADGDACWKKITAETSLPNPPRPDCSAAYQAEMARTPKFAKDIPALHTVIAYNAEAHYSGGRLTIAPREGKVQCWLPD